MPTEERLKYAIYQFTYKSLNNPQFLNYLKLIPKERRVQRDSYEQMGPLIDHIGEIKTIAQAA